MLMIETDVADSLCDISKTFFLNQEGVTSVVCNVKILMMCWCSKLSLLNPIRGKTDI